MTKILKDFYVYELNFSGIAAATSVTDSIQVQADSDFEIQKTTYFADIATAAQTDSTRVVPLCNVTILITGSGRQLMDSAVPVPNIFGTGEIPFILPTPKIIPARSVMNITVDNFDAASTYNLRLSFIGAKRFEISGNMVGGKR